jgi:hypothetical protein
MAVLAALVLLLEVALALCVLVAGAVIFGFSGEANRAPSSFGLALQFTAMALSAVPLGVVGWVAYRRFFHASTWPDGVPLGLWLPFVTSLGCLALAWVTSIFSELFRRG